METTNCPNCGANLQKVWQVVPAQGISTNKVKDTETPVVADVVAPVPAQDTTGTN